jgi:hypothetical protein
MLSAPAAGPDRGERDRERDKERGDGRGQLGQIPQARGYGLPSDDQPATNALLGDSCHL